MSFKGGALAYNHRLNANEIIHELETPFNDDVIDLIDALNSYIK